MVNRQSTAFQPRMSIVHFLAMFRSARENSFVGASRPGTSRGSWDLAQAQAHVHENAYATALKRI